MGFGWFCWFIWFGDFGVFLIINWHKKGSKICNLLLARFAGLTIHSTPSNPRSVHALRITSTFVICILLVLHCINNWSLYQTSFGRIFLSHCHGSLSKHHSQHWLQHSWFNITGISILEEDIGLTWAKYSVQICKSKWCLFFFFSEITSDFEKKAMKQCTNKWSRSHKQSWPTKDLMVKPSPSAGKLELVKTFKISLS